MDICHCFTAAVITVISIRFKWDVIGFALMAGGYEPKSGFRFFFNRQFASCRFVFGLRTFYREDFDFDFNF